MAAHDSPGSPPSPPLHACLRALLAAVLLAVLPPALAGCGSAPSAAGSAGLDPAAGDAAPVDWAIAIHGGAGTIPEDIPAERRQAYAGALSAALRLGAGALADGEPALDVVEKVVRSLEDDPLFNAGRGAVYTHDGRHELDAAIMDGRDLAAGAVAAVSTVKNPISLARLVMQGSPHVLLVGAGAEAFADEMGVVRVPQEYFHTEGRREAWQRALEERRRQDDKDTVGCVVRDVYGNLAAATSTGGLTDKRWGRVGDVPIIGAGTYADNRTAAISATGKGEEFIRHNVAHTISARMALRGEGLTEAAEAVIHRTLAPGDGGVIAVDAAGRLALVFNSTGMYRGAADSTGRFEIGIWRRMER
jgi:beta-aspartyl-peptidase (threonine type)